MDIWMIWLVAGIVCVIIEIFTPGFFFMSIGVSAIITGLFALFISNIYIQLTIFIIISALIFINIRKLSKKFFKVKDAPTNIFALTGKEAIVTQEISKQCKGYVKIGGEIWSAISIDEKTIEVGKNVVVKKVEGNKVIVKNLEEE